MNANEKNDIKLSIVDTLTTRAKKAYNIDLYASIVEDVMEASKLYNPEASHSSFVNDNNSKYVQGLFMPPSNEKNAAIFIREESIDDFDTYIKVMEHEYNHLETYYDFIREIKDVVFKDDKLTEENLKECYHALSEFKAAQIGYHEYFKHLKKIVDETDFQEYAKLLEENEITSFLSQQKKCNEFEYIYNGLRIMAFVTVCKKHISEYNAVSFFTTKLTGFSKALLSKLYMALADLAQHGYSEIRLKNISFEITAIKSKLSENGFV